MSTYRELAYMCLDKLKASTDDSYFKIEHIVFLLDKYRPFLLKQRYSDVRKGMSLNNYSRIPFTLQDTTGNAINLGSVENYTTGGIVKVSSITVPSLVGFNSNTDDFKILVNNTTVSAKDVQFRGDFSIVSPERFKYAGESKWLKKFVFVTLGSDHKLYFKWVDDTLTVPTTLLIQGIFETPKNYASLLEIPITNYLDMQYPLEEALVPPLLELVLKDIQENIYRPEDDDNNASDDLGKVSNKVRK
jgi:hypothetical protein